VSDVRTPVTDPDRGLRLALLLARAGEEGLSVESLLIALDCSRASLYRSLDRLTEAGWPVETVRDGERVLYRLAGGLALRPAAPSPVDLTPPRTRRPGPQFGELTRLVADLAAQGLSGREIAERLGVGPHHVWPRLTRLRRKEMAPPPPAPTVRETLEARVLALALAGKTQREIVAETGATHGSVSGTLYALRRDGRLPPPGPRGRRATAAPTR
jgi:biotin operon repressor